MNRYQQYLDCYLSIAEVLGVTPNIKDKTEDKRLETQRVSSYTTDCIFKQIDFLVDLFEQAKNSNVEAEQNHYWDDRTNGTRLLLCHKIDQDKVWRIERESS